MKRLWLPILILITGAFAFCSIHTATVSDRQAGLIQTAAAQELDRQMVLLSIEKRTLSDHDDETRQLVATQPALPVLTLLARKVLSGAALTNLSAAESEQLLAELGFNWNTTGDYLIVSKKSLDGISYDGMKGVKLTKAAIATLAISPEEQAAIETMTAQLGDARAAWAREHVQRTEPSGDIVAQYSLPPDTALAQSQLEVFTNGIIGTLGNQRGEWLQNNSDQWMEAMGLFNGPDLSKIPPELLGSIPVANFQNQPTTLTVKQYDSGNEERLNFTVQQSGNTMTTSVNPWQPFPEAFNALFPGGWKELAQREGFELPKEFNEK